MKSAELCFDKPFPERQKAGWIRDNAKRIVLARLKYLRHGELVLRDADEQYVFGRRDAVFPHTVSVTVTDPAGSPKLRVPTALTKSPSRTS